MNTININATIQYFILNNTYFIYDIIQKKQKEQKIIKFKNENMYINYLIDYIKENILKKYSNLKNLKINIEIYDKNNNIHKFILNILNYNQLKLYSLNKIIIIYIKEHDKIIFIGNI